MGKSKKRPSGSSSKVSKEKQADPSKLNTKTKQLKDWYLEFATWLRKSPGIAGIKKHFAQNAKDIDAAIQKRPALNQVVQYFKRNKRTMIKLGIILIILIVVANKIFPLKTKFTPPERILRVDAFQVTRVKFEDKLPAMGLVRGTRSVDIGFQVGGVIKRIYFREGQMVKKGDIIAQLDDTDARLKVEYNESKVKAAAKRVEVHQRLYDLKSIIEAKLDEIKHEYESQQKELEFAQQELSKTKLISPATGLLGPLEVEEGESVTPHTKVTSVFSVGAVYVDLGIIEKDISKIRLGQTVTVSVDAYPGLVKEGRTVSVSPVIEGKSRNFKVRTELLNDDPSRLFLPGMFARAHIYVYSADKAIVVSVNSVKDNTVYLIRKGRAEPQKVKTGYQSYDYVEILEGLKGKELIVAEVEGQLDNSPLIEVINTRKYEDQSLK